MSQEEMEKIFVESFEMYGDAIFRFCLLKVSSIELAEDMTQEVFTRYWQYLRDGKEMTNTRSFLYTIANNLAKDWYKKKKAVSLDEKIKGGYQVQAGEASPQVMAEYKELISTIENMEDGDKTVLLLKYVEGLEPKDIAALLGENSNAISVRINRAQKRLWQKFEYE